MDDPNLQRAKRVFDQLNKNNDQNKKDINNNVQRLRKLNKRKSNDQAV